MAKLEQVPEWVTSIFEAIDALVFATAFAAP
jgi:hypothetical protein